jgi:hypothetical protein
VDELNNTKYHLPLDENDTPDLATFIKADIGSYASSNHKIKVQIKYLDPKSYLKGVPANSYDVDLANRLSFSLVHNVMAGFTDFGVGIVREQIVAIPFDIIV